MFLCFSFNIQVCVKNCLTQNKKKNPNPTAFHRGSKCTLKPLNPRRLVWAVSVFKLTLWWRNWNSKKFSDSTVLLYYVWSRYRSSLCLVFLKSSAPHPNKHILVTNFHCLWPLPLKQWNNSSRINPERILMVHEPIALFHFKSHNKLLTNFGLL